jgi:protein-L-isoaspartate(D-aspartate) O-methyltransferase
MRLRMTRRLMPSLAAAVMGTIALGCAAPSSRQVLTPPPAVEASEAGDASPGATVAGEPAESLPSPRTLDRDFEDDEQTRQAREELVGLYIARVVRDERVLAAMRAVPRHSFVPTAELGEAYDDHPLRIEAGQTISQPLLVAQMTATLELDEGERVLEIGTGSGYQAAILAQLTDEVYSVEIIPELAAIARSVLDRVGANEVEVRRADGYFGWPEHAPYDAIIVTAAPDHLPSPLVQQLKADGGRMVIPIGPVGDVQTLWLVTRQGGEVQMEDLGAVQFVPFTREEGGS